MAVLALFEQARMSGIQRFLVAGSCFEYGRSGEQCSEIPTNDPLEPTSSYAASKAAASIALQQWAEEHQLSLEILRVFHVCGEGEAERASFIRRFVVTPANIHDSQMLPMLLDPENQDDYL